MIPKEISSQLEEKLDLKIQNTRVLSGGSINQSVKVTTDQGIFFLKWNNQVPGNFFEKEAEGLTLLKHADSGLRIPEVLTVSEPEEDGPGYLLIEFIEKGSNGNSHRFGEELAKLHNNHSDSFGLGNNNYIGSLPQSNIKHDNWIRFFANERIAPQLKIAVDSGKLESTVQSGWGRLFKKLDSIIPPCKPSLLHGDLWSGNYLFDLDGAAVLVDPAVYYGHPEMDLAFTKMFGGFDDSFYEGYESVSSLYPGFEERVPVYNLYPLLVHVNLFGGHYASQCSRFLNMF